MRGTEYKKFILNQNTYDVVVDPYFNSVLALVAGDIESNPKGKRFATDYSRYQRHVQSLVGTSIDSAITYLPTGVGTVPTLTGVDSCMVIPNSYNRLARSAELNASQNISTVKASYLSMYLSGYSDGFSLGATNFTIEFSFYFDGIYPVQSIWSVGTIISNNSATPNPSVVSSGGYGFLLLNSDLYFRIGGTQYKVNPSPLTVNTFYTVAVTRDGAVLKTFLNYNKTFNYTNSTNVLFVAGLNADTKPYRLYIGAPDFYTGLFTSTNLIDAAFSGGISYLRITKDYVRYPGDFYGNTMPFSKPTVANRLDNEYSNVLFNFPFLYDSYNYAPNFSRIINAVQRSKTPNFNYGGLAISGNNVVATENIVSELDPSTWTIEFYFGFLNNGLPMPTGTILTWLQSIITLTDGIEVVNLISAKSNGKTVFNINFNFYRDGDRICAYFSIQFSTNGIDFLTFPSETGRVIPEYRPGFIQGNRPPYPLPSNEIRFLTQGTTSAEITGLSQYTLPIQSLEAEPNFHIAISRSGGFLYFYANGVNVKILAFPDTLYQEINKLNLEFGSFYTPWVTTPDSSQRTLAIKGVKLTNANRYNSVATNDFFYEHSLQPLPLDSGILTHPKARVIAIVRVVTLPSISSSTCQWYVYVSQSLTNLVLADFTLSQTGGVTGATLSSITKTNEFEYRVTASTGIGNGNLRLNFIDRNTVTYAGTSIKISNYAGELDLEGETYLINKNAPIPTITSGSSPYISAPFVCRIIWDSAIEVFDPTKIGVSNGVLSNLTLIDEITQTYEFTVTPDRQDVVYVQALEGAGITDGNISSSASNVLARIFALGYSILQLPLDLANTFYDVSPNKYRLDEIIPNNTLFDNQIFPLGMNSSLSVVPTLEQGGLILSDFNAVGSNSLNTEDWTVEFNLRINTSNNLFSHIFSVEETTTGFTIYAINGRIKVVRTVDLTTDLFSSVVLHESDIFSSPNTPIYPAWNNNTYTVQQKYPHFAITKKGDTYRFYRNGLRIGLVKTNTIIDITRGVLRIGYYDARVTHAPFYLSNVRFTLGKALYTTYQHDVPALPYSIPTGILDVTELLDYISISSNNTVSNKAVNTNRIILTFKSIIPLTNIPVVTILGHSATVNAGNYNSYTAFIVVNETIDQQAFFSINISGEPNLPNRVFTNTTDNSNVFVENSPLTAILSTTEPNNDAYILYASILFNKNVIDFDLSDLTLSNAIAGNLLKASNENRYTFELKALSTGTFSVQLLANKVSSDIGTLNLVSNLLSRVGTVPPYIPDPYWSNVLLLLQPSTSTIIDLSQYENNLSITNVTVSNDTYPTGVVKSMKFSGVSSSISAILNQALPSNVDYCIEFYLYVSKFTSFSLEPPVANLASNVTPTSFRLNWEESSTATGYVVDIATTSNFNTKLPNYDNKSVGNVLSIDVENEGSGDIPVSEEVEIKSDRGFIARWGKTLGAWGYRVAISLNSNFSTLLREFSGKVTRNSSFEFGSLANASYVTPEPPGGLITPDIPSTSTTILQGILGNNNSYPKLFAFNDENTIRLYEGEEYVDPLIAEDIEPREWKHIALVNQGKYLKLYVGGELQDKIRNTNVTWDVNMDIGYALTHFKGYISSFRVTKGVPRYVTNFTPPALPLPIS